LRSPIFIGEPWPKVGRKRQGAGFYWKVPGPLVRLKAPAGPPLVPAGVARGSGGDGGPQVPLLGGKAGLLEAGRFSKPGRPSVGLAISVRPQGVFAGMKPECDRPLGLILSSRGRAGGGAGAPSGRAGRKGRAGDGGREEPRGPAEGGPGLAQGWRARNGGGRKKRGAGETWVQFAKSGPLGAGFKRFKCPGGAGPVGGGAKISDSHNNGSILNDANNQPPEGGGGAEGRGPLGFRRPRGWYCIRLLVDYLTSLPPLPITSLRYKPLEKWPGRLAPSLVPGPRMVMARSWVGT